MAVRRFDAKSWRESPLSSRRFDLTAVAGERQAVAEICERVRREGDAALRDLGRRFDGWEPAPGESFEVSVEAAREAAAQIDAADREALDFAAERIRAFHSLQRPQEFVGSGDVGLVTRPVRRAGVYAPGGRAVYPSTVLMTAIPPRVAGVDEVVLATPPRRDGSVPPAILAAAQVAGVDRVYRVGGAQAIAAMAYGTESIPRVDVVAGPGNVYVTLAKREVFGAVGVDGIAGPTEVVVLADNDARPDLVAADLAAQLEHDPMALAVLVTDSAAVAQRVEEEFDQLVSGLERAKIIREATCCIVVAADIEEAIDMVEAFAPEHLLVVTYAADRIGLSIRNAGAVFIGPYSTVPFGDYAAGPNHTLPTSGAARFASPLGVHTFLKRTSVLNLDRADVESLQDATVRLARLEGLGAHAHAVEVRLE
jgi:histidinol dehydrogenase